MRIRTSFRIFCFGLLPLGIGLGGRVWAAPPLRPQGVPRISLELAQQKELSGLKYEEKQNGPLHMFRKQARLWVSLRKGQLGAKGQREWHKLCRKKNTRTVFCDLQTNQAGAAPPVTVPVAPKAEEEQTQADAPLTLDSPRSTNDLRQIVLMLAEGDPLSLSDIRESLLHRALKNIDRWELIEQLTQATAAQDSCPSTALLVALGQKAEEFFPERRFREIAISLFARAHECGGDSDLAANKARYRRSLIHIWQNECREADPLLERLADQRDGEYVSRSLFWRAHCAIRAGKPRLAEAFRAKLLRENPLSYHGLLLRNTAVAGKKANESVSLRRVLDSKVPVIRLRTEREKELNPLVRAVEVLQGMKEYELAREPLRKVARGVSRTETGFQLYVALLLNRSEEYMAQFRIVAEIFEREPELISRATLELYYPLARGRFEALNLYSKKADPLLVSALIRQESGFNADAVSRAGALGLMQLMPDTARKQQADLTPKEILDPKTNIRIGTRYFESLLEQFGGDAELSLAAYNAGPDKVADWLRRYPVENRMLFFDLIPYKETRNYVSLIARNYVWYLSLYGARLAKNAGVGKSHRQTFLKRRSVLTRARPAPGLLVTRFEIPSLEQADRAREPAAGEKKQPQASPLFTVFQSH